MKTCCLTVSYDECSPLHAISRNPPADCHSFIALVSKNGRPWSALTQHRFPFRSSEDFENCPERSGIRKNSDRKVDSSEFLRIPLRQVPALHPLRGGTKVAEIQKPVLTLVRECGKGSSSLLSFPFWPGTSRDRSFCLCGTSPNSRPG